MSFWLFKVTLNHGVGGKLVDPVVIILDLLGHSVQGVVIPVVVGVIVNGVAAGPAFLGSSFHLPQGMILLNLLY